LLERGADIASKESREKGTPLHLAARARYVDRLLLLPEHRAHTERLGDEGQIPLQTAAGEGHIAVVESLLAKEANISAKDATG
jgi:ankyrin repeat protein